MSQTESIYNEYFGGKLIAKCSMKQIGQIQILCDERQERKCEDMKF